MRLALILAATLATPAAAFTAVNGLTVNPVAGGFEVVAQGADGPRQIWCAAGQYARALQGNAGNARIYIVTPYGPAQTRPGWRGVSFTIAPSQELAGGPRLGDGGNYSVRLKAPGFSLTTVHAEGFCADVFTDIL